jgi:uncharacterized membrane protein
MEYGKFQFYKILLVIALGLIVASFVTAGNYVIPLLAAAIAFVAMYFLRRKVKAVISDERIERIAGKAAYMTYSIVAVGFALATIILMALRNDYPAYVPIAYTLAYTTCGMIFLYAVLFKYYDWRAEK